MGKDGRCSRRRIRDFYQKKVWSRAIYQLKTEKGKEMKIEHTCKLLGYTKQSYYKSLKKAEKQALNELLIVELIHKKRKVWKRGSGRNLFASLNDEFKCHGIKIGRDKFFDLLRTNGLMMKRKAKKPYTTMSYHHYHRYPNLIKNMVPNEPDQIWVSDITYVKLEEEYRFCYLFLITDLYSRKIIGYSVQDNLGAGGAIEALKMAIKHSGKRIVAGTIHHSDRGVQYCCHEYTQLLTKHGVAISMTENGNPLENAIAERVNQTIKYDFAADDQITFQSIEQAKKEMVKIVAFYNEDKPHRSLAMMTPSLAYTKRGPIKRTWKSYVKKEDDEVSLLAVGEF